MTKKITDWFHAFNNMTQDHIDLESCSNQQERELQKIEKHYNDINDICKLLKYSKKTKMQETTQKLIYRYKEDFFYRLKRIQEEIKFYQKDIDIYKKRIKINIKKNKPNIKNNQLKLLKQNNKIQKIEIIEKNLIITTKTLKDVKTKNITLGKFLFKIKLSCKYIENINIQNITYASKIRTNEEFLRYQHYHICDNQICLGEYANQINYCINKKRINDIISFLIFFIENIYNENDCHITRETFHKNKKRIKQ